MTRPKPVRLNLGCGLNIAPGFINIDSEPLSADPSFRQASILHLPFDRDYADYVLADNVLEHLPMADIPVALHEIRRVLKPGGRAVLCVPDFTCIAKQWLAAADDSFNPFIYRYLSETIYGNQLHPGEFHRTAMSPRFLNFALQMCGFTKYTLTMYPTGGLCPDFPGMGARDDTMRCRNDLIVADVEKTT